MPDLTPDPLDLYLAEVRADIRTGYSEKAADRIREVHLPALLAMVEAVLGIHYLRDTSAIPDAVPQCGFCTKVWPCRDGTELRKAIIRELPGEES